MLPLIPDRESTDIAHATQTSLAGQTRRAAPQLVVDYPGRIAAKGVEEFDVEIHNAGNALE